MSLDTSPKYPRIPHPDIPKPTGRQRRILDALSRSNARIIASSPHFITDCRGWLAWDIQPTTEDLRQLVRAGWIMERRGFAARTEWVLTLLGREQVRA